MNKQCRMLLALLLLPFLLLVAVGFGLGDAGRQRPPGSQELAGFRLVLLPFSFQVKLARVRSEGGSAVNLVWSLDFRRDPVAPIAELYRDRTASPDQPACADLVLDQGTGERGVLSIPVDRRSEVSQ